MNLSNSTEQIMHKINNTVTARPKYIACSMSTSGEINFGLSRIYNQQKYRVVRLIPTDHIARKIIMVERDN